MRHKPYSVLLFDEIEKAHHDVFNILLQILDDGRLTDSHGRTVDFKNAVIIMTSNIGSNYILEFRGTDEASYQRMKEQVLAAMRQHFRPEFLNRVDETVVFRSLTEEQLVAIVGIQAAHLQARLGERGITLELSTEAAEYIAKAGYDPVYGARPLKRVIQRDVETPLAKQIVEGTVPDGSTVIAGLKKGRIVFRTEPPVIQETGGEPARA